MRRAPQSKYKKLTEIKRRARKYGRIFKKRCSASDDDSETDDSCLVKKGCFNVSSFKVWYGPMSLIAGQPPPCCIIIIEIAISTLATQDDSENLGSPAGLEDLETSTTAQSGSSDVSTALSSGSDDTKLGRVIAQLSQFKIKTEPKSTSGDHGSKSVPIPTAVDLTGSDDDEPHIVSTDVGPPSLPSRHERIVQILRDAKRRRLEKNPPKKEERSTMKHFVVK